MFYFIKTNSDSNKAQFSITHESILVDIKISVMSVSFSLLTMNKIKIHCNLKVSILFSIVPGRPSTFFNYVYLKKNYIRITFWLKIHILRFKTYMNSL